MTTSAEAGMTLDILPGEFVVCKLKADAALNPKAKYYFYAKTPEETSLVCMRGDEPAETEITDGGWRCFRVEGPLDFSLVGIMARLSSILAAKGISIYAISTFDTDYILVRRQLLGEASSALEAEGCVVRNSN